jgi:hypothetical protein
MGRRAESVERRAKKVVYNKKEMIKKKELKGVEKV